MHSHFETKVNDFCIAQRHENFWTRSRKESYYGPPTKLREGNIFSCVCPSVILFTGGFLYRSLPHPCIGCWPPLYGAQPCTLFPRPLGYHRAGTPTLPLDMFKLVYYEARPVGQFAFDWNAFLVGRFFQKFKNVWLVQPVVTMVNLILIGVPLQSYAVAEEGFLHGNYQVVLTCYSTNVPRKLNANEKKLQRLRIPCDSPAM